MKRSELWSRFTPITDPNSDILPFSIYNAKTPFVQYCVIKKNSILHFQVQF